MKPEQASKLHGLVALTAYYLAQMDRWTDHDLLKNFTALLARTDFAKLVALLPAA
jgi:hypothetical protein